MRLGKGLNRKDGRFGIEGVKDGLDQDKVGAAIDESPDGFEISRHEPIKMNVSETRIINVW